MIKTILAILTLAIIFTGCVGTIRIAENRDKEDTLNAKPLNKENNVTKNSSEMK
jgi:PBP1b-binding outer membrane lipoprotein LpoB